MVLRSVNPVLFRFTVFAVPASPPVIEVVVPFMAIPRLLLFSTSAVVALRLRFAPVPRAVSAPVPLLRPRDVVPAAAFTPAPLTERVLPAGSVPLESTERVLFTVVAPFSVVGPVTVADPPMVAFPVTPTSPPIVALPEVLIDPALILPVRPFSRI